MPLANILLGYEIANKSANAVLLIQTRHFFHPKACVLEAVLHRLLQHGDESLALLRPVALKVSLGATHDIYFILHSAHPPYFALK